MGHVYVEARVKARRSVRARFMVDTGATHSLISPALAKKAGLRPSPYKEKVRLANGRTVSVPMALGFLRLNGREAAVKFWIGPCDEPLLGVESLEILGMAVDPARGSVRPTRPFSTRLGGWRVVGR